MSGAELELRPAEGTNTALCYRNYKIAEINIEQEQLINRRISRIL